ncbi:putative bifunctional diguanylate cyclase/phosphodiesterase [Halalkalibacter alkalisediminis]|uniref:Bifunctional diguanylate cyclase/phosphodiesterase n=1 Tax=Halalkalibacter alkalisediminis TaxID=935616 RepID=A0ABV6NM47_9BACI|nr:bifunctional diguanylate cyclase/phosphodiesterase [Halalkalibacter alkalisediminis]
MEKENLVPISTLIEAFEHMYGIVFLMEFEREQFIYRYISPAAKELASLGDECLGRSIGEVYPNYLADHLIALYTEARQTQKPVVIQDKFNMESVDEVANLVIMPLTDQQSSSYYISYTERMKTTKETTVDLLTGLPSYSCFIDKLEKRFANNLERPFVLCYMKLHPINKPIHRKNESQGTFIIEMVKRLQAHCQADEIELARVIGNEFIFYFSMKQNATEWMKKIQKEVSTPMLVDGEVVILTTSIGMTFSEGEGKTATNLINEAYHAMLQAKQERGNAVREFDERGKAEEIIRQPKLEHELRKAIVNQEFVLYFQPIVHVETGKVHYEALLRWFSAQLGSVPPDSFIIAAENNGYIKEIDAWVIENVCKFLANEHSGLVNVSINLSTKTLETIELEQTLLASCWKYGIDPSQIELELTEHTLLDNEEELIKKLCSLRKAGFKVAIDDFGMRHASFNYLRVLPVDKIKIDKAFIQNISRDSKEFHIVTSILSLAKKIGVKVTAEGIETKEQARLMMEASCDELQGYLFSKPAPKEILQKVERQTYRKWKDLLPEPDLTPEP